MEKTIYKFFSLAMLCFVAIFSSISFANAKNITVGPTGNYKTIQEAVNAAVNGDSILISAGTYYDQSVIIKKDISLIGVNGRPLLTYKSGISNKKAYFVTNGNITIENIEFADAKVPDKNGAGIRFEGGKLTIKSSVFRDNQEGILSGAYPSGEIIIQGSSFLRNGHGDGWSHGVYIGNIKKFTVTNSTFEGTKVGHHIKSRAQESIITNNIINDGTAGTASYDIDLPNGGNATVSGNVITKGSLSQNTTFISYGEEGGAPSNGVVTISGNTFNSKMTKNTIGIKNTTQIVMTVTGNTFNNVTTPVVGPAKATGNKGLPDTGANTIKLTISGDYYKENPKIEILADGKTLSGNISVTSNYSNGSWQELTFTTQTIPSTLEIGVTNGLVSSTGVRNIHIKSLSVNGKNISLSGAQYKLPTLKVDSDGTLSFAGVFRIFFTNLK